MNYKSNISVTYLLSGEEERSIINWTNLVTLTCSV